MANDLMVYDVPNLEADLEVDFLDAPELEAMEEGIRKIAATNDLLALVQGVAIVRIEREGLWRQAGFETLHGYRVEQGSRLAMPRSTISNRRRIAEAYLENRKFLGKVDLSGHVQKLIFLPAALSRYERREVLSHFKTDSYRDFKAFAVPTLPRPDLPDVDLSVRDGELMLDGEGLMEFAEELPDEEREFVTRTLKAAYRARRGSCLAHVVPVYDEGEARAVDNFLKKLRAKK